MSEHDQELNDLVADQSETDQSVSAPPERQASAKLRDQTISDHANDKARMDAANQSLADALRITYWLLRGAMIVLIALFAISGVQSINEGERGIKVRLGKQVSANLEPGLVWSLPYPIGEIVTIEEGTTELAMGLDFMPNARGASTQEEAIALDLERFNDSEQLDPAKDNSNITADFNIAHTQWTVNYRRTDHSQYIENLIPEQEEAMLRSVVRRAAVQVIATVTIDDLLKNSSESLAGRVRTISQATLDELNTGMTIDRVVLTRKNAALSLNSKFSSVQTAAQEAGKQREDALLTRDQMLNEVAGRASAVLLDEIDEYERLVELRQHDQAETQLARIDAILEGRAVEIKGEMVEGLISGEVSELLSQANAQSSYRVTQAIAQLDNFRSKQAQFEANPKLMIARDWSSAMSEFLDKDFVSTMVLPKGVSAEVLINNDPDIAREQNRQRTAREAQDAVDRRRDNFRREFYKTQRGLKEPEEQ